MSYDKLNICHGGCFRYNRLVSLVVPIYIVLPADCAAMVVLEYTLDERPS